MGGVYLNDHDRHAAQWLRGLMAAGLIPEGTVDERPVQEVRPADLAGCRQCHFFAGIGGWCEALRLAGWPADRPVWTASLPCQPFSSAGKRKGVHDERHLWPVFLRLVRECRPATLLGEQVDSTDGREWLARVQADLEQEGYAVGRASLNAAGVGAPHIRQRLYWLAVAAGRGRDQGGDARPAAARQHRPGPPDAGGATGRLGDAEGPDGGLPVYEWRPRQEGAEPARASEAGFWSAFYLLPCRDGKVRRTQSGLFPLAHGVPFVLADGRTREGVSRAKVLRGIGNAIVPQVAALFIRAFLESAP